MGLGRLNIWVAAILVSGAVGGVACSSPPGEQPPAPGAPVTGGEARFHERVLPGLGGNGRACSDCHMDSDSFQLSPANVEARYQKMRSTGVDDPLFRPIDADDFVENGANARDYSSLR